jgi:acyl-CoA thioester hydrolase
MRFHERVHGVYFDDLDAFQILHNARYLLLFEHAIACACGWRSWGARASPSVCA